MDRKKRRSALKTRLALIALGLGLGFSARWVSGWITDSQQPRHFEPMPVKLDDSTPAAEPAEDELAAIDEAAEADADTPAETSQ